MKVDSAPFLSALNRSEQRADAAQTGKTDNARTTQASAITHLSHISNDSSGDINQARVAELRQAIADGQLHIDVSRIADHLIAGSNSLADK